ncbi:MAG: RICIN domain-containing protein, partial [Catenulispora sp.]
PTPTHSTSTPAPTRHSSSSAPSHTTASSATSISAAPPPSNPAAVSSSPLPPLSGTYRRFQNAQSGDCLAQPAGSGTAAHQGCAASRAQGWEYFVPLGGILGAVTGQFELVNAGSGQCLTGAAGAAVGTGKCTGAPAQMWTKAGGSGSATEFRNIGDGKCLKTAQGAVTEGTCGSGDSSGLWTENGTVS